MANKTFKDLNSLFKHLQSEVADAMSEVGEAVAEDTKRNVDEIVYGAGNPKTYERTYQLRDSIKNFLARVEGNRVLVEIDHDTSLIISNSDKYQHGSNQFNPSDVSEFIDEIVHEGLSGNLFGDGYWRKNRKYFEATVEDLMRSKRHIKVLKEALNKKGIKTK